MAEPLRDDTTTGRGISLGGDDLPAQAADWVVEKVDTVKAATTDNAVITVRAVVYGLVVAVLGVIATVALVTIMIRMADAYLPIGSGVGDATWAAHLFVGGIITILGLGAWASRGGTGAPGPLIAAGVLDTVIVTVMVTIGIIDAVA